MRFPILIATVAVSVVNCELWSSWHLQQCVDHCGTALLSRICIEEDDSDRRCSGNLYWVKEHHPQCVDPSQNSAVAPCLTPSERNLREYLYDAMEDEPVRSQNIEASWRSGVSLQLPTATRSALDSARVSNLFWLFNSHRVNVSAGQGNFSLRTQPNSTESELHVLFASSEDFSQPLIAYLVALQPVSPTRTVLGSGKSAELTCPIVTLIGLNVSFAVNWFVNGRLQRLLGGSATAKASSSGLWECRAYLDRIAKELTLLRHRIIIEPAYRQIFRRTIQEMPWDKIKKTALWVSVCYLVVVIAIYLGFYICEVYFDNDPVKVDKEYTKKMDEARRKNTNYSREDFENYFIRNQSYNSLATTSRPASPRRIWQNKLM